MKKLIGLMMFLAFALQSNAQYVVDNEPWCPPGATWIYRFFSATSREYKKYEYVKDTIIEQQAVKKLDVYNISYIGPGLPPDNGARLVGFGGSEYMYESNDSIFWYDTSVANFAFLYRFNAQVADEYVLGSYRNKCGANQISDTVSVLQLYTDTFGNRIFDVVAMSYDDSIRLGNVIAKIGPFVSFLPESNPYYCSSFNFFEELVCYLDNVRGSIQFSNQGGYGDCYSISTSVRDEEKNTHRIYTIYPNPTNNTIKVDGINPDQLLLQIYNYAGLLVKEQREFTGEVSVLELPTGMYVAKLKATSGEIGFGKFIKQ